MVDENKLMQTIVRGSDWQTVLTEIVAQEGLNPWDIDLVRLTDAFINYLNRLKTFDFRIPARFILIAAILLRLKCEFLFEEEGEEEKKEEMPSISLKDVPELSPPISRKATRKITLDELITALNKAFAFKERKEQRKLRMRRAVEMLIEPEEDIEEKIKKIYEDIKFRARDNKTTFSKLVPSWTRKNIVMVLVPLLHLEQRGTVRCEQPKLFGDIYIFLKEDYS